jgi:hypothetical protein
MTNQPNQKTFTLPQKQIDYLIDAIGCTIEMEMDDAIEIGEFEQLNTMIDAMQSLGELNQSGRYRSELNRKILDQLKESHRMNLECGMNHIQA